MDRGTANGRLIQRSADPATDRTANGRLIPLLIDAPDIMPTLLGLCGLAVPSTVQGRNFSAIIVGEEDVDPGMSTLLKVLFDATNDNFVSKT